MRHLDGVVAVRVFYQAGAIIQYTVVKVSHPFQVTAIQRPNLRMVRVVTALCVVLGNKASGLDLKGYSRGLGILRRWIIRRENHNVLNIILDNGIRFRVFAVLIYAVHVDFDIERRKLFRGDRRHTLDLDGGNPCLCIDDPLCRIPFQRDRGLVLLCLVRHTAGGGVIDILVYIIISCDPD